MGFRSSKTCISPFKASMNMTENNKCCVYSSYNKKGIGYKINYTNKTKGQNTVIYCITVTYSSPIKGIYTLPYLPSFIVQRRRKYRRFLAVGLKVFPLSFVSLPYKSLKGSFRKLFFNIQFEQNYLS